MITSEFGNIEIKGIAAAVPVNKIETRKYESVFDKATVEKNISVTGIKECYHADEKQTSSDLGFAAAQYLLEELDIDRDTIGVLIFIGSYLDYQVPPTACILQYRLGLSQNCIVFDTDLACSGYVYGLQTISAILASSSAKRGLIITGDITSKVISPLDKSRMLFGDGGTATLVEKTEPSSAMYFGMKTDGTRFKSIIVPGGAYRNSDASRERTLWSDGNIRSDYDLFMNGTEVFSFTMTDVPKLAEEFIEYFHIDRSNVDNFILHQPNLFILTHLAKKLKIPKNKMPISLDRYGNTSVCAIPLTICDAYGDKKSGYQNLFLYGFGVGLSWACAFLKMDTNNVLPVIHTDDSFKEGYVEH